MPQFSFIAFPALLLAATVTCADAANAWRDVPGAPEVQIDLASIRQDRTVVTAWLRWRGRAPIATDVVSSPAPRVRAYRTAVQLEFDCGRRTLRPLATSAHDSSGLPISMDSTPGAKRPVMDGDLGWAYDAVCEAARASARF